MNIGVLSYTVIMAGEEDFRGACGSRNVGLWPFWGPVAPAGKAAAAATALGAEVALVFARAWTSLEKGPRLAGVFAVQY